MAFANIETRQDAISDMNITPLVDVMLVVLVIFMIAAPIFTRAIPLPSTATDGPHKLLPPIDLRIDASGDVFFAGQPVPLRSLQSMFAAKVERAGRTPPALKIEANGDADYQVVAKVLASAQNAGLTSIGFTR